MNRSAAKTPRHLIGLKRGRGYILEKMMNQGWSCPGCGRCYSPTTPQCFTCGQPTYTSNKTSIEDWMKASGKWDGGATITSKVSAPSNMFWCNHPMSCERKDGYCAKCHSEFY